MKRKSIDGNEKLAKKPTKKNGLCQYRDCMITPHFNYEGEKIRMFCATHKSHGMVNVSDKRCQE